MGRQMNITSAIRNADYLSAMIAKSRGEGERLEHVVKFLPNKLLGINIESPDQHPALVLCDHDHGSCFRVMEGTDNNDRNLQALKRKGLLDEEHCFDLNPGEFGRNSVISKGTRFQKPRPFDRDTYLRPLYPFGGIVEREPFNLGTSETAREKIMKVKKATCPSTKH